VAACVLFASQAFAQPVDPDELLKEADRLAWMKAWSRTEPLFAEAMRLIRFGGHLPKGGYDVPTDVRLRQRPAPPPAVDDDFKAKAVRLMLDGGKSIGAVSRDLDLTESAVREWVKQARADRTHGRTGLTTLTSEREELARLRKENRILRGEREILRKAAASFATERR
jgi:transposase